MNSKLKKLKDQQATLNEKWNQLSNQCVEISKKVGALEVEIQKLELEEEKKTAPKAKFKKGEIVFRDMGTTAGDYLHPCNGRVRITSEPEFQGKRSYSTYSYDVEYIKKDGTLAKKQPSTSAWENQLKKNKEGQK